MMETLARVVAERPLVVGMLLFEQYEQLDVFGPFELLAVAGSLRKNSLRIVTLAPAAARSKPQDEDDGAGGVWVRAAQGPRTRASFPVPALPDRPAAPHVDVLVVPGGPGVQRLRQDSGFLHCLEDLAKAATLVLTVCTGSLVLAKTGLLDGKRVTTNKRAMQAGLDESLGDVDWQASARWVVSDCGKFVTSSGVSAGMDATMHVLAGVFGQFLANKVAEFAEYVPNTDPSNDPFAVVFPSPAFPPAAASKQQQQQQRQQQGASARLSDRSGRTLRLGVLLYDQCEMLDTFGPLEMFGMVNKLVAGDVPPFELLVIAEDDVVQMWHGPRVQADVVFGEGKDASSREEIARGFDLLLVPGGVGCMREVHNPKMLALLRDVVPRCANVMTVCTGSPILASAGLLDGRRATTNKLSFDLMRRYGPNVSWVESARWVQDGKFFTSSGVTAGTDLALFVVQHLFGKPLADAAAQRAEYVWNTNPNDDPFAHTIAQQTTARWLSVVSQKAAADTVFTLGFRVARSRMLGITKHLLP